MRHIVLLLYFFVLPGLAIAQTSFGKIEGLPTDECFDLLMDSKGYLWVGHDLGLSRFDGKRFVHFSNKGQTSLSLTGLIEDKFGRVWCHDFTGKVYYVEKEQLKQLPLNLPYARHHFVSIGIILNELVVLTSFGAFIYNLDYDSSRFIAKGIPFSTMSLFKDKAVFLASRKLYMYRPGTSSVKLIHTLPDSTAITKQNFLERQTRKDTFYFVANANGTVIKMILKNERVQPTEIKTFNRYVNTLSIDSSAVWVNTKRFSINLSLGDSLMAGSVSDIISAKNGSTWISTLDGGVLRKQKTNTLLNLNFLKLENDERITAISATKTHFLWGTSSGRFIITNGDSSLVYNNIPHQSGGTIERIVLLDSNECIISTSGDSYLFSLKEMQIKNEIYYSVKDAERVGERYYISTSSGMAVSHRLENRDTFVIVNWRRALAVTYNQFDKMIYMSDVDGLYKWNGVNLFRVYYKNNKIKASSLISHKGKLYIGTFSEGLLIMENGNITEINARDGLLLKNILKMKMAGDNQLFLFSGNQLQVLSLNNNRPLIHNNFSFLPNARIYDAIKRESSYFVFFQNGAYQVDAHNNERVSHPSFGYLYAVVNSRDSFYNDNMELPYGSNNVQFYFSSPSFGPDESVTFHYMLEGAVNATWQLFNDNTGVINFPSLEPGTYKFRLFPIVAGNPLRTAEKVFVFRISKPIWLQWWFITLAAILPTLVVLLFFQNKIRQKNKLERMRDNISSDLHDDIGSVISSINIYSSLAKSDRDSKEYINTIQTYSQEVLGKLDDLVWSINPANDDFEHLVEKMESFAVPVLTAAGISCSFQNEAKGIKLKLDIEAKRNLYLILKEAVNNIIKHSQARCCYIDCSVRENVFTMTIADDGQGFFLQDGPGSRNGLTNMKDRAERIQAKLSINTKKGEGTAIRVSLPMHHMKWVFIVMKKVRRLLS